MPLTAQTDSGAGPVDLARARERLALLCRTYASVGDEVGPTPAELLPVVVERLHDLAALTAGRAAAGTDHVADHVVLYQFDAAWVERHAPVLGATGR